MFIFIVALVLFWDGGQMVLKLKWLNVEDEDSTSKSFAKKHL